MTMYLAAWGSSSAAGEGAQNFWAALCSQRSLRQADTGTCRWPERKKTSLETLLHHCERATQQALAKTPAASYQERWGIILASTKGITEDLIWAPNPADTDPITPLLNAYCERSKLSIQRSLCLSNACASSHSAVFLAREWLSQSSVDHVLVLAADESGKFITSGFRSLGALSPTEVRPFSGQRDGLQLGDAAAVLILSTRIRSPFAIDGVALEIEGSAVTRPSSLGESLEKTCREALHGKPVDLVVAHGTATQANDEVENRVFQRLFGESGPYVTGSKWCIGHTLGASGAMDVIAATLAFEQQTVFPLGLTEKLDPTFQGRYVLQKPQRNVNLRRALITSLGFGGVYAALTVSYHPESAK